MDVLLPIKVCQRRIRCLIKHICIIKFIVSATYLKDCLESKAVTCARQEVSSCIGQFETTSFPITILLVKPHHFTIADLFKYSFYLHKTAYTLFLAWMFPSAYSTVYFKVMSFL